MTNYIEFDVYNNYRAEGEQRAEAIGAFHTRLIEARQALAGLQAEYQQKIEDGVKTGKDVTAELDALDKKIADAERLVSRRNAEHTAAYGARGQQKTTATDVINAYRQDYAPTVKKAVMEPVHERLQKARALILSAVVDLYQADQEYREIYEQVKEVSAAAHKSGETSVHFAIGKPFEVTDMQRYVYKLVDEMEAARVSKQLPAGVEYIEKVEEMEAK